MSKVEEDDEEDNEEVDEEDDEQDIFTYVHVDVDDCNDYERSCLADGECILATWWCDAYPSGPDCSDGSDETHCSASDCVATHTFHCGKSMTCTPLHTRCDGVSNCPDDEDETNCKDYKCLDGTVKCKDDTCAQGDICDGTENCSDGEDEDNCEEYKCPSGKIKCKDHSCVWGEQCNGLAECDDGSDENNCQEYECPTLKIKCNDHICVWGERCNSWLDCQDGSDEDNCEDYECPIGTIKCADHTCTNGAVCDGWDDCKDKSDEKDCIDFECAEGQITCADSRCAWGDRCDGNENCRDKSDEENCNECKSGSFLCIKDGKCIPGSYKCDSWPDCSDASDDVGCGDCDDDRFRCGNSHCVDVDKLCDGQDDCGDFSDERCNTSSVIPIPSGLPGLPDTEQLVGPPLIFPIAPSVDHIQLPGMPSEDGSGPPIPWEISSKRVSNIGYNKQLLRQRLYSSSKGRHVGENVHSRTGHDYRQRVGEPVYSRTGYNYRQKSSSLHEDRRRTKVHDNRLSKGMSRLNAYRRIQMAKSIARSLVEKRNRFAAQMEREESIRHALAGQKIKHTLAGQKIKHTAQVEEVVRQLKELTALRDSNENEKVQSRGEININGIRRHMLTHGQIKEHFTARQLYDAMKYLRQNE
ncbi:LRP1B [Mytilus coruscus]|uniref:LRP1B n=1 Tax=Mytilus coruscus TaxID=42192 RepID=A0A6J8AQD7_MYTCO|nr:LRP1B [Mytilus coruscus]